jgi:threonylcarbamoyladenosine tRNA methylthiotransferase MtaB
MKRRYAIDDFRQAVSLIRKTVPLVAITTDVMVGFPGESAAEFEESYLFCKEMGFANMHVFVYSTRPGTLAARMSGQVNDKVKKERSRKMLELVKEAASEFRRRFIGADLVVLWENEIEPGSGLYSGLSQNYIRAYTESSVTLTNQLLNVRPVRLYKDGLRVEIKNED